MKCEAMNLFKKINCDEALIGDFHSKVTAMKCFTLRKNRSDEEMKR